MSARAHTTVLVPRSGAMGRDWVVRTDWHHLDEVVLPSLEQGLLRQGWGYQDNQDLNVIGPLFYEDGRSALDDDQKATWRRVQRFCRTTGIPFTSATASCCRRFPAGDGGVLLRSLVNTALSATL
jgi:hypothetical protein